MNRKPTTNEPYYIYHQLKSSGFLTALFLIALGGLGLFFTFLQFSGFSWFLVISSAALLAGLVWSFFQMRDVFWLGKRIVFYLDRFVIYLSDVESYEISKTAIKSIREVKVNHFLIRYLKKGHDETVEIRLITPRRLLLFLYAYDIRDFKSSVLVGIAPTAKIYGDWKARFKESPTIDHFKIRPPVMVKAIGLGSALFFGALSIMFLVFYLIRQEGGFDYFTYFIISLAVTVLGSLLLVTYGRKKMIYENETLTYGHLFKKPDRVRMNEVAAVHFEIKGSVIVTTLLDQNHTPRLSFWDDGTAFHSDEFLAMLSQHQIQRIDKETYLTWQK